MKHFFLFFFLVSSAPLFAQTVSGIYSGTLVNDSTKRTQHYELALSDYRDKITGYAYTTFVVNDTFYYSIKRVKATKKGNQLVVEDEKMLVNNFPESPAKKVRQTNIIPLGTADTLTQMDGSWQTNRTKEYYSLHGALDLKRDNDSSQSALVAHLRELNIIAPENKMAESIPASTSSAATPVASSPKPAAERKQTVTTNKHGDLKKMDAPAAKPAQPATAIATPTPYTERKKTPVQTFDISADSLVLSFYDNGVVDGDVISVYVNGENIIAHAKLLEAATKKIIHLPATIDSVELLLVAETLGSIPPNTGLLVVQDGSARYEVRFSADLQTNAAIVFRKRK